MENNYSIHQNYLKFSNDIIVEFDFPIKSVVEFDELILCVLNPGNQILNRNVFALTVNGEMLWQIEKCEELDAIGNCPFSNIQTLETKLILYNWCGFTFIVDPKNGKIIEYKFTK